MADAFNQELPPRASDELRSVALPRAWRGYDREAVDLLVARVAEMLSAHEDQASRLETELASARENYSTERDAWLEKSAEEREQHERFVAEATREREEIAAVFEQVKAEREERIAYTERLEQEIAGYRELEKSLKHAVVAAERIGSELRALGEREATVLLEEARFEARRLLADASNERDLLIADVRRIRDMLQATQSSLDERTLFTGLPADTDDVLDVTDALHDSSPLTKNFGSGLS
ncbi:MAG TPA: DivIVA domain-containing protein [Acidimicrobiales bacterium]|nr:DivIVA domain-containing protein [Acidimicrobiales bacterium]